MPDPPVCPTCGRGAVPARWRPFCSERCKLVDLGRWLSGGYRIPGSAAGSPADEVVDDAVQGAEPDR